MKNFQQEGRRLRLYPDRSVTSGELVIIGDLAGVASGNYDIDRGDGIVCDLEGVFMQPKVVGAWSQGQRLYYRDTEKKLTTVESGNTFVGHAADAATNDSPEGPVRLKG